MDFFNELPTEAGIELPGAFDAGLEQRLARRQGAGPVRPSLVIEPTHALVAQLDRASDFESEGREFESLRARQDPLHSPFTTPSPAVAASVSGSIIVTTFRIEGNQRYI